MREVNQIGPNGTQLAQRAGARPTGRLPLHPARRVAAFLLALVVLLSTVVLMVGTWLRATAFTADWYRPILSDQAFLDGVRTVVVDEISAQAAAYGLPATVLTHGLDNAQISQYLNRYLDNFVEFLNYRAEFRAPDLAADLISTPVIAYARDAAAKLGLKLTADQEQQLRNVAVQVAHLVQTRLNLISNASFLTSPQFQRYHSLLYTISQLGFPAALVLGVSLLLLFLVLFGHGRSFLGHAGLAIWLAAGVVLAAIAALKLIGFPDSLAIAQSYLKQAAVDLSNRAMDNLMQRSLIIFAAASFMLVLLLLIQPRRRNWAADH